MIIWLALTTDKPCVWRITESAAFKTHSMVWSLSFSNWLQLMPPSRTMFLSLFMTCLRSGKCDWLGWMTQQSSWQFVLFLAWLPCLKKKNCKHVEHHWKFSVVVWSSGIWFSPVLPSPFELSLKHALCVSSEPWSSIPLSCSTLVKVWFLPL